MERKLLLLVAVLALSACQDKESKEVASTPASNVVVPTSAPVADVVLAKPSESSAVAITSSVVPTSVPAPKVVASVSVQKVATLAPAPKVVAPAHVAEVKPVVSTKQEVAAAPPKPEAVPVVVKPVAVSESVVTPKAVLMTVSDADGVALAKKRNCFVCHMIDKKVVGPAWKDVAAKYRGDAAAQARMEAKIGKGGSGAWGSMAMPPQPQVTAEERTILARFILNLK
jgi:cytochrome c